MYSGNVFTSVRNTRDNTNMNKNMTGNNSLNNEADNRMGREKGVHRLWDILSSALEDTSDVRCNKKEAFCTIINSFGYPLTPLTVAEMMVLIGKLIASKGKTDKEQYETTATALVDVIDSLTTLNWDAVFWSLPMIDSSLKITSIECFAFVVAVFHTQKNCEARFPVEIGFQEKWQSSLSQALFLKWVVMSVGATSTPSLYQRIPFLVYLRYVEVPGDATHMKICPPLFSNDSPLVSLWSNSHLVLALANVAISDTGETASNADAEQTEAARIAIELLKRPTVNYSDVFLATLVKCEELFLALSRFLASVCINQLWQMLSCGPESQHIEPQDFMVYLRGLASLSPIRFGSVVLASLYPRHGERVEFVIAALQQNVRLLSEVLQGKKIMYLEKKKSSLHFC
jgi:hypothetical protein